ncbi:MAG: tetratricopeptide repeat protein [Saprospiraceae bacterium]|nr:tetratricopeptide repeat protein [Saprospiraceae bacterium]
MKKNKQQNDAKPAIQIDVPKRSVFAIPNAGFWLVCIALALTFIAYIPSLTADFVNWDDNDYVMNNKMIRSFSDFSKFFITPVQGNYHPITMLSLATNYAISGYDPFSYHLFNILFHLINVYLVYKFILKLSGGSIFIAFATALFFGVHPMHVESVAWVTERKDVLYTLFFILGLSSYLNYLDTNKQADYFKTFIWFLLSLASKPAALVFPAILFVLDYYKDRPLNLNAIKQKVPFIIFSGIMVYLTLHSQTTAGATDTKNTIELSKRIFFPFYGYMMYIFKMFWPLKLSAFYPFSPINEALSKSYLLSPFLFAASVYLCLKTFKKYKEITFGFSFYLFNLVLVLQFFLVGSAIISERYTYVPYIGLFYLLFWYINKVLKMKELNAYILVMCLGVICTFLSFRQAAVWKNTRALWEGAIKSFPTAKAYSNLAYVYQQEGLQEKALSAYEKSLKLNVIDKEVFYNRGVIYFNMNKDSQAILEYNQALALDPFYLNALNGRGSVYAKLGRSELAMADLNKSLELNPKFDVAYKNRASAYFLLKEFDLAINDYKKYLELQKNDAEGYSNLAVCYLNKRLNQEAIDASFQALKVDSTFAKAWTNIGGAYINLKQYQNAIVYLDKAFLRDSTNDENLKFLSLAYLNLGDTAKAMSFFEIAQRNPPKK